MALAGYGRIGEIYARSLAEIPAVELVIAIDPLEERRAAFRNAHSHRSGWTACASLDCLSHVDEGIDRAIVATPPAHHSRVARVMLGLGADVLLEKGGKNLAEVTELCRIGHARGLVVASALHQEVMWAEVRAWLRSSTGGTVRESGYTWYVPSWRERVGPIEDRSPHAIASLLATVGQWSAPTSVRASVIGKGLEEVELLWSGEEETEQRKATARLGADSTYPHELLEEKMILTKDGPGRRQLLCVPGRTTETPTDREYVPELVDPFDLTRPVVRFTPIEPVMRARARMLAAFVLNPQTLAVVAERVLLVQSVYDAVRRSLADGGCRRVPEPVHGECG